MTSAATVLRDARARAGLSRRALAARAGVPVSTVSRIEGAASDPTVGMLERVLAAAGARLVLDVVPDDAAPTLASLATAVDRTSGRLRIEWTRLRGYADWAARHPDQLAESLAAPPARTGTALDAVLAALAEQLAAEHGLSCPRWTRAVGALPSPWSPPGTPRMHAAAEVTTPQPFRNRNVILARSALFREPA